MALSFLGIQFKRENRNNKNEKKKKVDFPLVQILIKYSKCMCPNYNKLFYCRKPQGETTVT